LLKSQNKIFSSVDDYVLNCNSNIEAKKNNDATEALLASAKKDEAKTNAELKALLEKNRTQKAAKVALVKKVNDEKIKKDKLDKKIQDLSKQLSKVRESLNKHQAKATHNKALITKSNANILLLETKKKNNEENIKTLAAGKKPTYEKYVKSAKKAYNHEIIQFPKLGAGLKEVSDRSNVVWKKMLESDCSKGDTTPIADDMKKSCLDPIDQVFCGFGEDLGV